jgi:hypothetical protein
MTITGNTHAYTKSASRAKNPDEVSSEFPERGRGREPGPDDVYDPDFGHNRGGGSYDGPHYYDHDSSGGSSWVLF